MKSFATLTSLLFASSSAYAAQYGRTDQVVGQKFYDFFEFQAIADPTHGRVNYVDQVTAVAHNLTFASGSTFIARADSTTTLVPGGAGRESVRLRSRKTYTNHVAVFDIRHMPQGCGTWPAVWETKESNWPAGGEIDILEGVNDQGPNAATLHTVSGCTMPASREQLGIAKQDNCDWLVNGNAGCGVAMNSAASYGPAFNSAGGGWYAVERTNGFIKVWFWPRTAGNVPADVQAGGANVNTDSWGTPQAFFPDTSCDIPQFFQENNIIINLTFCGDWAGNVYAQSGCPSTCEDFVNNNPAAFKDAFFDFGSINVYV